MQQTALNICKYPLQIMCKFFYGLALQFPAGSNPFFFGA